MRNDAPLEVIARRKWLILATFLIVVVGTAVVSKTLDKVYGTSSTLLVSLQSDEQTFDTVQASQAIARSYVDIIDSPNIAERVADRLGPEYDDDEILDQASFEAVPQTQLVKVTIEDRDPDKAKRIADTYALVFIDYVRQNLPETEASISLADFAPTPDSPARPRPTLYVLVAALLGLALGIALAFLRERLDRRLRTSEDVETQFDVPILARVPRRGRSEASLNAFRESYRVLRTNLRFASTAGPLRSIAVVSGREGEGKTTTVAQLGLASAEVAMRVVCVEADLRRPGLQKALLPERPEPLRPGLSNYLVEAASIDDVVHPTTAPNVDIIPAGPLPPSPAALLESRRGRTVASELSDDSDLVIFDCPPLNIGADASVLSGWVDGVIVVVDLQSATDRSVRAALRQLEAVQAPVLGLVLNRERGAESTYDYYYAPETDRSKERPKERPKLTAREP